MCVFLFDMNTFEAWAKLKIGPIDRITQSRHCLDKMERTEDIENLKIRKRTQNEIQLNFN